MKYAQYKTTKGSLGSATIEVSSTDNPGKAIDESYNKNVQKLLDEGRDPSLLPDKVYRNDHPVKAFCFTGNGLYFSGSMCWCEFLKEWGVCHLSYPGWVDTNFVGEGVKAALEGINGFINEHPELATEENVCFYGNITEDCKFEF